MSEEKDLGGRPTAYKEEYNEQARKLCLLGATDEELGDFFDVTETTINNWKIAHPKFFESIKAGKIYADSNVAESLYKRALGYEHPEEKVFCSDGIITTHDTVKHYPPDTGAAMAWLKNRQNIKWRDRQDINLTGKMDNTNVNVNYDELPEDKAKELFFSQINQQED